mmetsp:Transcript_11550/g.35592  ORF Transcript_11550/g.35592 Transcript_11550/m.35592 type:complete len:798 (-) Transcript_11550:47-2440(-)
MGRRDDDRRRRSRSRSRSRDRARRREPSPSALSMPPPAPKAAPAKVDYAKLASEVKTSSSKDGEMSMTVDDTNALRERLGLKPLNSGVSSDAALAQAQAERNYKIAQQERAEARRLADIEAELARAKRKREANAPLPKSTLGDDLGEVDDATAWVARSRAAKKDAKDPALAKLEAERRARLLMEQEQAYTSADLAGMKVAAHSAEALERGDALILTLEDEQILDYDKDQHGKLVGLKKDSGPQLVNQNRAQDDQVKKRRAELYEEAALHAGGAVADDYEFATGNAAGGSATLAKYDDRSKTSFALTIGSRGGVQAKDQTHLSGAAIARLAERIRDAPGDDKGTADASSSTLKTGKWGGAVDASRADFEAQRDYLTQDEARKMFRKKEKKAKKARKALAAPIPQNTGSVLDGLDDVDEGGERGSRATKVHKDGSAADAARRAANWDAAQRRAQEKGDVGLGKISKADVAGAAPSRSAAPMEVDVSEAAPKPSSKFVAGLGDDDDDAELRAALDRARATAVARPPEGEAAAAAIAARVKTEAAAAEDDAGATDALVFTSTTEFTARLRARLEERAAEKEEAAAAEAQPDAAAALAEAAAAMSEDSDSDDAAEDAEAAEAEARGELVDFLHKQPLARDGLAATLGLLRQTGDGHGNVAETHIGRARDRRDFVSDGTDTAAAAAAQVNAAKGADMKFRDLKLEYRDADGKLLTRKEAFRQMCHKFHGKAPGKKKTDKMTAREAERQRSIRVNAGGGSMSILQQAQVRTGQAYVPINNQQAYLDMGTDGSSKKKKKKKKEKA